MCKNIPKDSEYQKPFVEKKILSTCFFPYQNSIYFSQAFLFIAGNENELMINRCETYAGIHFHGFYFKNFRG